MYFPRVSEARASGRLSSPDDLKLTRESYSVALRSGRSVLLSLAENAPLLAPQRVCVSFLKVRE